MSWCCNTTRSGTPQSDHLTSSVTVPTVEPLQGVINILEAILEADLGESVRFFEASSCEIFGKGQESPCNEGSAMRPQTPYGKAKLLAHLAIKHYRCTIQARMMPPTSSVLSMGVVGGCLAFCG